MYQLIRNKFKNNTKSQPSINSSQSNENEKCSRTLRGKQKEKNVWVKKRSCEPMALGHPKLDDGASLENVLFSPVVKLRARDHPEYLKTSLYPETLMMDFEKIILNASGMFIPNV
ncbi:unnamed protein product [Lepeophtheirus salmonis]|uniref:(salmon louse) hypothetical protein n=1 Tax=Lepeophtheirus salmonis TaxID=72036 RepID=A0A7R8D343_LEPSM|nr:unnamed protein product [Lepeophtheirus salmonis]CAF2981296.1 unnamed protein product [Lepeophtheirus salmonis]